MSVSINLRTCAMGHSLAKNFRAVSFRICWLSLNPNCMKCSSQESHHGGTETRRNANCVLIQCSYRYSDHPITRSLAITRFSIAFWQPQNEVPDNVSLNL